jgi:hypothetical protein
MALELSERDPLGSADSGQRDPRAAYCTFKQNRPCVRVQQTVILGVLDYCRLSYSPMWMRMQWVWHTFESYSIFDRTTRIEKLNMSDSPLTL